MPTDGPVVDFRVCATDYEYKCVSEGHIEDMAIIPMDKWLLPVRFRFTFEFLKYMQPLNPPIRTE